MQTLTFIPHEYCNQRCKQTVFFKPKLLLTEAFTQAGQTEVK
jgi:hypothetical protein